ncbi:MAG: hypothetical protein M2R45_00847 [Verrucomicrobia subdivision 3 bacterium]|nr:hypothetical protein [Limisphaerales bacterium]MCS1413047.1 hypothetical protein [Limisphaerales bacterium]
MHRTGHEDGEGKVLVKIIFVRFVVVKPIVPARTVPSFCGGRGRSGYG